MALRRRRWWRSKLPEAANWRRTMAIGALCTIATTIILSVASTDPLPLSFFYAQSTASFPLFPETGSQITAAASEPAVAGSIYPGRSPPWLMKSALDYAPTANISAPSPEPIRSFAITNYTARGVVDDEPISVQKGISSDLPEIPLIGENSAPSPETPQAFTVSNHSSERIVGKEEIYFKQSAPPPQLETQKSPRWSSPDQALAFAKMEVDHAPPVLEDPDLYAPLFRNISVFKRSYELMEKTLKVYVYRDGSRPFFHTPPIKGIYASEGWFMKIMERNKQFVVKDGNRAHLFYLPYSVHQLELALAPGLQNIRHMSLFIKDYVNKLASSYPFWNRSHGSDHFIVACHDWGPYTTKEHEELFKNSIKALCNADASEGIFIQGRDVSLPETTIKIPRRPLRAVGGKPISQRNILAFFAGNMHGRVRPVLLKYWDGNDQDMRIYGPLPTKVSKKMSYIEHMKSSKFCLCPMGYEVNSPRIVEAIYYECVPVIIADNFALPFDDVLDWKTFSVTVEEKDIPNLKDILLKISVEQYTFMHTNVQKVQKHFLWHAKPLKYDIFHMILHSVWFSRLNQIRI